MSNTKKNFLIAHFPMGPHLREWFGLSATEYKGAETENISSEQLATFSEAFLESLEDGTPKNQNHLVDILEELIGMNLPLLAIKFVESYPVLFPQDDFRAQLHYGNAAMLVGDLARAESAFIAAQKLVPEEPAPYVNLTQIYCHDDLFEKAREWCLAGLNIDPENTRLWELAAWLEQSKNHGNIDKETVAKNIATMAREKNSWTGTSLACDLKDSEDPSAKADALAVFWDTGVRDPEFLIEYTAVLGVAGRYDKIPPIVWQVKASGKTPWQLMIHLAQAHLGLGRSEDALEALNSVNKYKDLTHEARTIIDALRAEVSI